MRCDVAGPGGLPCELDAGHPGPHRIDLPLNELIADVGPLVDGAISDLEQQTANLKTEIARGRRVRIVMWFAVAVNAAAVLLNLGGLLS